MRNKKVEWGKEMTFGEMIWQSDFLIEVTITAYACFLIWFFFWGCATVRKFLLWREMKADREKGEK